jgi:uncharacterized protein YutD
MEKVKINDKEFELVENYRNCYNKEKIENRYTEYFDDFDYILGDFSCDLLRLKGFCDKKNPRFNEHNDIAKYLDYVQQECPFGCRYFLLKRIKN